MFVNSKKSFEICEGENKLVIPKDYIGEIPAWAAKHWLVQAAIKDGSITTPKSKKDKALDQAEQGAAAKAAAADNRED